MTTKYRAKQPEIIVTASVWDPAIGKTHIAVAPDNAASGDITGTIHSTDGVAITGIIPGSIVVAFDVPAGTPPKYEVYKTFAEFEAFFEPIKGASKAKALASDTTDPNDKI